MSSDEINLPPTEPRPNAARKRSGYKIKRPQLKYVFDPPKTLSMDDLIERVSLKPKFRAEIASLNGNHTLILDYIKKRVLHRVYRLVERDAARKIPMVETVSKAAKLFVSIFDVDGTSFRSNYTSTSSPSSPAPSDSVLSGYHHDTHDSQSLYDEHSDHQFSYTQGNDIFHLYQQHGSPHSPSTAAAQSGMLVPTYQNTSTHSHHTRSGMDDLHGSLVPSSQTYPFSDDGSGTGGGTGTGLEGHQKQRQYALTRSTQKKKTQIRTQSAPPRPPPPAPPQSTSVDGTMISPDTSSSSPSPTQPAGGVAADQAVAENIPTKLEHPPQSTKTESLGQSQAYNSMAVLSPSSVDVGVNKHDVKDIKSMDPMPASTATPVPAATPDSSNTESQPEQQQQQQQQHRIKEEKVDKNSIVISPTTHDFHEQQEEGHEGEQLQDSEEQSELSLLASINIDDLVNNHQGGRLTRAAHRQHLQEQYLRQKFPKFLPIDDSNGDNHKRFLQLKQYRHQQMLLRQREQYENAQREAEQNQRYQREQRLLRQQRRIKQRDIDDDDDDIDGDGDGGASTAANGSDNKVKPQQQQSSSSSVLASGSGHSKQQKKGDKSTKATNAESSSRPLTGPAGAVRTRRATDDLATSHTQKKSRRDLSAAAAQAHLAASRSEVLVLSGDLRHNQFQQLQQQQHQHQHQQQQQYHYVQQFDQNNQHYANNIQYYQGDPMNNGTAIPMTQQQQQLVYPIHHQQQQHYQQQQQYQAQQYQGQPAQQYQFQQQLPPQPQPQPQQGGVMPSPHDGQQYLPLHPSQQGGPMVYNQQMPMYQGPQYPQQQLQQQQLQQPQQYYSGPVMDEQYGMLQQQQQQQYHQPLQQPQYQMHPYQGMNDNNVPQMQMNGMVNGMAYQPVQNQHLQPVQQQQQHPQQQQQPYQYQPPTPMVYGAVQQSHQQQYHPHPHGQQQLQLPLQPQSQLQQQYQPQPQPQQQPTSTTKLSGPVASGTTGILPRPTLSGGPGLSGLGVSVSSVQGVQQQQQQQQQSTVGSLTLSTQLSSVLSRTSGVPGNSGAPGTVFTASSSVNTGLRPIIATIPAIPAQQRPAQTPLAVRAATGANGLTTPSYITQTMKQIILPSMHHQTSASLTTQAPVASSSLHLRTGLPATSPLQQQQSLQQQQHGSQQHNGQVYNNHVTMTNTPIQPQPSSSNAVQVPSALAPVATPTPAPIPTKTTKATTSHGHTSHQQQKQQQQQQSQPYQHQQQKRLSSGRFGPSTR